MTPRVSEGLSEKRSAPNPDCPLGACLKFLGGAWTPEILWYLGQEKKRFGELKRCLSQVSAKVLTARLRELEELGVVDRHVMHTSPPTVEYSLTTLGRRFEPVLAAIAEVGKELKKRKIPEKMAQ